MYIYTHTHINDLDPLSKVLRAFASGFFKLFYFTISKPTLSFIPYHFTSLSTSELLFSYSTH